MWTTAEYNQLMAEAVQEFKQWEKDKRKNRVADKAKHKAIRLAKLDARRLFEQD